MIEPKNKMVDSTICLDDDEEMVEELPNPLSKYSCDKRDKEEKKGEPICVDLTLSESEEEPEPEEEDDGPMLRPRRRTANYVVDDDSSNSSS